MLNVSLKLPIRLAVVEASGVRTTGNEKGFAALKACADAYGRDYAARGITSPGSVPGVEVARALFHALGIDPTRHRPCSEALLNRALKQKPQPAIGTLVDIGNWCALDFLLPLGIYDVSKIVGNVVLRKGSDAETYRAINGRDIHLTGRYLLADEVGPFGSPITDSIRTAVTEQTTHTAVILYAPSEYPERTLVEQSGILAERILKHCGGELIQNRLLGGA